MIIDFHMHASRPWDSPEAINRLVNVADRFEISLMCVSMGREFIMHPDADQIRASNDYILWLMREWPGRFMGFCYLNPNLGAGACRDELNRCVDAGMRGIKLWVACVCSEPQVNPIVAHAQELGLPVLQHTWKKTTGNLERESRPEDMAELAARHPDANLVMAHAGGLWEHGLKAIQPYPNVYIDTSGANPTVGMVETAVRTLGLERVLYGSDAPGRSFASQLAKVEGAGLTTFQKRLILRHNARHLLGY